MKSRLKYFIITTLSLLTFIGCVKDKGNYDYSEIAELDMTKYTVKLNGDVLEDAKVITLAQNEELDISFSYTELPGCSYSWSVYMEDTSGDDAKIPAVVIGTNKNLKCPFEFGPGLYVLYYKVRAIDGNEFFRSFSVRVESVSGMFVLHADASNKGDISSIATREILPETAPGKLITMHNILSISNKGYKIENPQSLWVRNSALNPKLIYANTNDNTISIDYNTFLITKDDYKSLFAINPDRKYTPQAFYYGFLTELLISNGQIYGLAYVDWSGKIPSFGGGHIGIFKNEYYGTVATFQNEHQVVFNMTQRRFEYTTDMYNNFMQYGSAGGVVDIADTKMDILYFKNGLGNSLDAVMKDGANIYYTRFDITVADKVLCTDKDLISSFEGVNSSTIWEVGGRGDAAFYAPRNNLYIYNHKNNTSTIANLDLASTAEIVKLKVFVDSKNAEYSNALLFVGVNDGSIGKVYQYAFNPLSGTIYMESKKEFSGFGKIIDLDFKK